MKTSSISSIKNELSTLSSADLLDVCLRLARYKKENKELLSYLLFEARDEQAYIAAVKNEMDIQFAEINLSHLYYTKKGIRKILKNLQKYSRYSGHKQTEAELLIYFCFKLKGSGVKLQSANALTNMYVNQLKKINTVIAGLHEDLQYDYKQEVKALLLR